MHSGWANRSSPGSPSSDGYIGSNQWLIPQENWSNINQLNCAQNQLTNKTLGQQNVGAELLKLLSDVEAIYQIIQDLEATRLAIIAPKYSKMIVKVLKIVGVRPPFLWLLGWVQVHINLGKRWNYSSFARLVSSFCWRATKTESATTGPSPQYLWEACKVCTSIVYPYVSPLLYVCHNFAWFLVSKIPVLVGYSKSLLYSIFPIYNSA